MNVIWDQAYPPQMAANGSFAPLDMSTITEYPTAGDGRYAVLSYVVNPISLTWDTSGEPVQSIPVREDDNTEYSFNFTNSLTTINFNPSISFLEVFNNDNSNKVYIRFYSTTSVSAISAIGLPILAQSYYSIERDITTLTVGTNLTATDIRVFGHYRV